MDRLTRLTELNVAVDGARQETYEQYRVRGDLQLTVDGNLAPCRGVFQKTDDFARRDDMPTFAEAWNGERYRVARGLFRRRTGASAERELPCYECPTTIFYERWGAHRAAGGSLRTFEPGMIRNANGAWNYFWTRGQVSRPGQPFRRGRSTLKADAEIFQE